MRKMLVVCTIMTSMMVAKNAVAQTTISSNPTKSTTAQRVSNATSVKQNDLSKTWVLENNYNIDSSGDLLTTNPSKIINNQLDVLRVSQNEDKSLFTVYVNGIKISEGPSNGDLTTKEKLDIAKNALRQVPQNSLLGKDTDVSKMDFKLPETKEALRQVLYEIGGKVIVEMRGNDAKSREITVSKPGKNGDTVILELKTDDNGKLDAASIINFTEFKTQTQNQRQNTQRQNTQRQSSSFQQVE